MISPSSEKRFIISICGPPGTGKSRTAVALADLLGHHRSVRVPTDYYLIPATKPLHDHLREPLEYDWRLLEEALSLPSGISMETPQFDFETFQRVAESGRSFTLQPIRIVDAMYPCPFADIRVIIRTPSDLRRTRIADRDKNWGTNVLGRWEHLEICVTHLDMLDVAYELCLSGLETAADNAARIFQLIRKRL